MYEIIDPGFDPVRREVPASLKDRSKGSFTLLVRRVPWVKWRSMAQEFERTKARLTRIEEQIEELYKERPATPSEIELWDQRGAALVEAQNRAADTMHRAQREMIAWGLAGIDEVVNGQRKPYPYSLAPVGWLNKEWPILSEETLDQYYVLGLLPQLFVLVTMFQNNTLPETLDGFFSKKEGTAPAVVKSTKRR